VKEEARLESPESEILLRRDQRERGVVAYLTINNARRLNALNSALMDAFVATMTQLATEDDLRVVVLSGAGPKAFIVGADINEMAGIKNAEQATAFITRLHRCCDAIRNLPVPVIARIHGYCFGGGLEMAAACDVRIASHRRQRRSACRRSSSAFRR
jgi:enoyl-CoA hydratase